MATTLYLKAAVVHGIGSYRDATSSVGSSTANSETLTVTSGTDVPLTATQGGAAIAWISGKVPSGGFTLSGQVDIKLWAQESAAGANAGGRVHLYKWSAGVLTQLTGSPWDDGIEFTTSNAAYTWSFTPTSMAFAAGDRLVIVFALTAAGGTMSGINGRFCTIKYDNTSGNSADSSVTLTETVAFDSSNEGTLAATDGADTAAFDAVMAAFGTLDATEAADTAAFAGSFYNRAILAATEARDIAAFNSFQIIEPDFTDFPEALREAYALAPADEVLLHTLEIRNSAFIDDDGEPTSIFVVQNNEDVKLTLEPEAPIHGGEAVEFIAMAFGLALTPIEPGATPEAQLTIDNVDRVIVEHLDLAIVEPEKIIVVYRVYLASDPSGPQLIREFELSDVRVDALKVTGRVRTNVDLRGAFPRKLYTAAEFPGLVGR